MRVLQLDVIAKRSALTGEIQRKILRDPVRYNSTDILPVVSVKRLIAIVIYRIAPFFFPGFVYILRKTTP